LFTVRSAAAAARARACRNPECKAEMKRRQNRVAEARYKEKHGEWRARADERKRPARAEAGITRRRAKRQGLDTSVELFTRPDVYERDKWVCGICGKPVDRTLEWPDKWSASLDHIVPIEQGGPHSFDNCQLAHLHCNLSKSNGR
jgi:5-methylcytosine-specific restriction endonuclease McrA